MFHAEEEVKVAWEILKALELRERGPGPHRLPDLRAPAVRHGHRRRRDRAPPGGVRRPDRGRRARLRGQRHRRGVARRFRHHRSQERGSDLQPRQAAQQGADRQPVDVLFEEIDKYATSSASTSTSAPPPRARRGWPPRGRDGDDAPAPRRAREGRVGGATAVATTSSPRRDRRGPLAGRRAPLHPRVSRRYPHDLNRTQPTRSRGAAPARAPAPRGGQVSGEAVRVPGVPGRRCRPQAARSHATRRPRERARSGRPRSSRGSGRSPPDRRPSSQPVELSFGFHWISTVVGLTGRHEAHLTPQVGRRRAGELVDARSPPPGTASGRRTPPASGSHALRVQARLVGEPVALGGLGLAAHRRDVDEQELRLRRDPRVEVREVLAERVVLGL